MKVLRAFVVIYFLFLTGCAGLPGLESITTPPDASTEAPAAETPPAAQRTPDITPTPAGPVVLNVWVPPEFDPAANTPQGDLLRSRLDAFLEDRPDLRIEVRVKAIEGPGGILDTLTTASAAAPLALPDLVAMPRSMLETAALKGLLHPFDGLSTALDDSDWFDYARQLAHVQSSTFGLPFAGDAVLLVYRSDGTRTPPPDWQTALAAPDSISFAAADPQSLFTLLLYQASGGAVRDEEGRPFLDAETLEKVLEFYQDAGQAGITPFWLTQLQTDDQAWEAFKERRANMTAAWASTYFSDPVENSSAAPVPTSSGEPYTLTDGWVWSIASPHPDVQEYAARLAEFLTESSFLAEWTEAGGYIPTRPTALESWTNSDDIALIHQVLSSTSIYPSADILTRLGPALEQATIEVLKQENNPQNAARAAAESVNSP